MLKNIISISEQLHILINVTSTFQQWHLAVTVFNSNTTYNITHLLRVWTREQFSTEQVREPVFIPTYQAITEKHVVAR